MAKIKDVVKAVVDEVVSDVREDAKRAQIALIALRGEAEASAKKYAAKLEVLERVALDLAKKARKAPR